MNIPNLTPKVTDPYSDFPRNENQNNLEPSALLKIFRNTLYNQPDAIAISKNWETTQIQILKKAEQAQYKEFIEFIVSHIPQEKYSSHRECLQNLLKRVSSLVVRANLIDLRSFSSQKKRLILTTLIDLDSKDLTHLYTICIPDLFLLRPLLKEAQYIKEIKERFLTDSAHQNPQQIISSFIHHLKQTESLSFLLDFTASIPPYLKMTYLYELCSSYIKNPVILKKNEILTERDILSLFSSLPFTAEQKEQILISVSHHLFESNLINRALSVTALLSDQAVRKNTQENFIATLYYDKQTLIQDEIEKKLLDLYRYTNIYYLIKRVLKEYKKPDLTLKTYQLLLMHESDKSQDGSHCYDRIFIYQLLKDVLKEIKPNLSNSIDKLSFQGWFQLIYSLFDFEETEQLILFASLMPALTKGKNFPSQTNLLFDKDRSSFLNTHQDNKLEESVKELIKSEIDEEAAISQELDLNERLLDTVNDKKTLNKIFDWLLLNPIQDRFNLLKIIMVLKDNLSGDSITHLLKIPIPSLLALEPWLESLDVKNFLDYKQVVTDLLTILKQPAQEFVPSQLDSFLSSDQWGEKVWEHYVVRNPLFAKDTGYNTGNKSVQINYGKLMHQAIFKVSSLIKKSEVDFTEVFKFASLQRQQIAKNLNQSNKEEYGIPRTEFFYSECEGIYEPLGLDLIDIQDKIRKGEFNTKNLISTKKDYSLITKTAQINSETIELSKILINLNLSEIKHTDSVNIEKIHQHMAILYDTLIHTPVENETDKVRIIEIAGQLFWWFCESKPVNLGDPSIAEIIVRSIFNLKGIEDLPWKKDLIPWAEVVKEFDVEQFGKKFHTLFDREI